MKLESKDGNKYENQSGLGCILNAWTANKCMRCVRKCLLSGVHSCGTLCIRSAGLKGASVYPSVFILGWVCEPNNSHRLRLKQSQQRGKDGLLGEAARERWPQVAAPGVPTESIKQAEGKNSPRGILGGCSRAAPGPTAVVDRRPHPCPRSRLTRPLEYLWRPRRAERHRVIMGRPGGRQQLARGPPAW